MASSSRVPELGLLLLLLAAAPVRADDEEEDGTSEEASETPGEEIVVFGEAEVVRRRAELDRDLRTNGYYEGKRKGDRMVYRPEVPWKPSVVVYDDGFVVLKRSPVRFGVPRGVNPWWNLVCPLAPHVCVRIGGQIVSERKLNAVKAKVLAESAPELASWQQAISATAMEERINQDVPEQLDAAWRSGVPLDGDGFLEDHAARRRAILQFWSSRSCTPEGDRVADAVALFLSEEVQSSPWPASAIEVAEANDNCLCGRVLDLP